MMCIRQRLQERNAQILKNTNNSKANKEKQKRKDGGGGEKGEEE